MTSPGSLPSQVILSRRNTPFVHRVFGILLDPQRNAACSPDHQGAPHRTMHEWQSLSHVRWECKYHVVIIPEYRRKVLYGKIRHRIGRILRELCQQRGVELLEGHCMPDHIHMCLGIPPKHSVAHMMGFLKGKSAVRIHRERLYERRMTGLHFWATRIASIVCGCKQAACASGRGALAFRRRRATGQTGQPGPENA